MKPVGYYIVRRGALGPELDGENGSYYNYFLDANGVWIVGENSLISGQVCVAEAEVRGLGELQYQALRLEHGLIPGRFFQLALDYMLAVPEKEVIVQVCWRESGYYLAVPTQAGKAASVDFVQGENVVLDLHSHGRMRGWFSTRDDKDEKGLRVYGVVGGLGKQPELRLRLGVYGYYQYLEWSDVFSGDCPVEEERDEFETDALYNDPFKKDGGR